MSELDFRISPEPSPEDREAVLAAVREVLRREESLRRPAPWSGGSWTSRRVGVSDLRGQLPPGRAWVLSARLPWGGREFGGLIGRGDAR
ncbi:MAG TPA: hypothetical protein VM840_12685 [Actinomycetota bacterium]|nr:hypothetical protein [Actinomycetota bacterium]